MTKNKKDKSQLENIFDSLFSLIRSKYFWRGFLLLFMIGFFLYLLFSDITLDCGKKKITSKGKIKSAELKMEKHNEKN